MAASVKGGVARLHRPSAPAAVDADLEHLWTEAAREAPVARALMANLVVFCEHRRGERVDFEAPLSVVPLDEVVRRHPSRVVILHHSPRGTDPGAPIAAAVTIVTFGAATARYGVEEIAVRCACCETSLPSIVRYLTRGDVPTSIWWTEDLSRTPPVEELMGMGRQLVYDSRAWRDVRQGVRALAPLLQRRNIVDLADVNWRRLSAMRQALAHAAQSVGARRFTLGDVRIAYHPGEGALAWLLAGWLASRLTGPANASLPVRVDERRRGDEILDLEIGTGPGAISATMNPQRVVVTIAGAAPPFHLAVRRESDADAVAAELTTLGADVGLFDTLAALSRHFAA
ncbi:MAG TPA: glucose-6-phosphate dehydrogenase assembly protein OpcA [Vicinamibacterales bacterium]|jgi:glucose-6-phosphate dehydrogenase assembly protein OpcA|nr:glucose-6-phosphate dehydrogenase assembly protein OpcA [Vicinamibacterales bacterium]